MCYSAAEKLKQQQKKTVFVLSVNIMNFFICIHTDKGRRL